jgi:hypothetical protein
MCLKMTKTHSCQLTVTWGIPEMTQHITQEQATQIAAQFAEDATYEFNIANAAIQHYLDQRAKDLPELPPTKLYKDANGVLHPTAAHCRTTAEMEAYGQQCAAQARKLALEEAKSLISKLDAMVVSLKPYEIVNAIEALKGK